MKLEQYLEVRRCFSFIRAAMPVDARIIFDEFAILCELHGMRNESASSVAAAQRISCPTMTHRSNHLCELGFMTRTTDAADRRKLRCALTRKGTSFVHRSCKSLADSSDPACGLADMETPQIVRTVARVGSLPMTADSIVLVSYLAKGVDVMPVMQLVEATGLLQPTVSMAVLRLEEAGLIERRDDVGSGRRPARRPSGCVVVEAGKARAAELAERIEAL